MYKKKKFKLKLRNLTFINFSLKKNNLYSIFECYGISFFDFICIKDYFIKLDLIFFLKKKFLWFFIETNLFFKFLKNSLMFFSKMFFISKLNKKYFTIFLDTEINFKIQLIFFVYNFKYLLTIFYLKAFVNFLEFIKITRELELILFFFFKLVNLFFFKLKYMNIFVK